MRAAPLTFTLIVAAVSLGLAIHVHDGEYTPLALGLLTISLITLVAPFVLVHTGAFRELLLAMASPRFVSLALYAALTIQFAILFASWPGVDLPHRGHFQVAPLHAGLSAAVLLIVFGIAGTAAPTSFVASRVDSRAAWLWFPALLVVSLLLGIWMIHSSPAPHIDVWVFQQDGAAELLRGRNPYAMTFPDIYHSSFTDFAPGYARSLVAHDRVQFGFIYPPLSLLLSTIGFAVAGDHRYAQVLALVLAAAFIGYTRPGQLAKLAAALLLFTPRVFFVLGRAWTEPFVLLFLAITIFVACRRYRDTPRVPELRPELLGVSLGLLFAVKQYAILALPLSFLLVSPRRPRRDWFRMLWPAVLVAAIATLPFALWNLPAFWKSTVTAQQLGPFRWDALTYLVWYGMRGHAVTQPSTTVLCSALAMLVALGLALWRAPRDPTGFVAGFAAALALVALAFFAFNKQAFANYYFFVIGALCCAIAACRPLEQRAANPHAEPAE